MKRIMCSLTMFVFFAIPVLAAEAQTPPVAAQNVTAASGEINYGDMTSATLATSAWDSLSRKDYDKVYAYTNKCIELYKSKALVMQAGLTAFSEKGKEFDYWALNDVGVCYYIKGMALKEQGKLNDAKEAFNAAQKEYLYAQCWDPKGWFWKVADAAKDQLKLIEFKEQGKEYDFGDYSSSTITTSAWQCLDKKDFAGVEIYTRKCMDLYEEEAIKQQANLKEYLPKEQAFNAWALNDVGTCYYILGDSLMEQKKYKEAKEVYNKIIEKLSYSQCWDPRGWFWKPAQAARGKINKIIAEQGV